MVERDNLLNAVIEGTDDAVFVKDLEGRYLMVNSAAARNLGWSAVASLPAFSCVTDPLFSLADFRSEIRSTTASIAVSRS